MIVKREIITPIINSGFLLDPILPIRGMNIADVMLAWYMRHTVGMNRLMK